MKEYLVKIKHIVPIYLLVACSIVIILLALRWGLSISTGIIDLKEENWEFIIPMAVSFIGVIVWVRPRFRILKPNRNDSWSAFFIFVSWISIMAASDAAQMYLTTSTGKLLKLDNINQISEYKPVRYYHVGNFAVLRQFPKPTLPHIHPGNITIGFITTCM